MPRSPDRVPGSFARRCDKQGDLLALVLLRATYAPTCALRNATQPFADLGELTVGHKHAKFATAEVRYRGSHCGAGVVKVVAKF